MSYSDHNFPLRYFTNTMGLGPIQDQRLQGNVTEYYRSTKYKHTLQCTQLFLIVLNSISNQMMWNRKLTLIFSSITLAIILFIAQFYVNNV